MNNETKPSGCLVLVGLALILFIAYWGYNRQESKALSKPWWRGTQVQLVCDSQGAKCYELPVTITVDTQVVSVTFPSGGSVYGVASCQERYGGGRFCDFYDQHGEQWDITPLKR